MGYFFSQSSEDVSRLEWNSDIWHKIRAGLRTALHPDRHWRRANSYKPKKNEKQCCSAADSEMLFVRILTHDMIFQSSPSFWLNFHTPARQFSLVLTKCLCSQQFTSFGILISTEWAEGRCSLDSKHTLIYLWKEKTCKTHRNCDMFL